MKRYTRTIAYVPISSFKFLCKTANKKSVHYFLLL